MSSFTRLAAAGASRMNADAGAGLGGLRLRTALLAAIAAIAAWAVLATPAHAAQTFAPLAGSTFEGGDGNQISSDGTGDGTTDWETYAATSGTFDSPFPDPTGQDTFFAGHEDTPDTWTIGSVSGGVTPAKSNALAVWSVKDPSASSLFFYFSFLRESTSNANSFFGVELNKATNFWTNSVGTSIPCRSTGDLMISYEVDSSSKNVNFKIYQWTGSGGPPECPEGRTGSFTDITTPELLANIQGYMNFDTSITNFLSTGAVGTSIDKGRFGEGAVNLTQALQGAGSDSCVNFGQATLHSRSSSSLSSAFQDTVNPEPIVLRSCTISGTKFHDLNANGVQDAGEPGLEGWRIYADKNGNGQLDAGDPVATTAADGSYTIAKVPAGTYSVREAPPVGDSSTWYCSTPSPKGTLSTDCEQTGVTVSNGSNVTGVDFGNYQKAKLTVAKQTVPAGGGPFSFTSGDLGPANASFQLSDGGTKTVSVDPGDTPYQVAETTDPNYNLTSIDCTGDTVAPDSSGSGSTATFNLLSGEDVTCTFTNTRKTGKLEVVKSLSPANDPGRFDLQVDGSTKKSDAGDGDTTGKVTLDTGTHTVGEVAGSTGDLADYQKSIVCKDDGGAGSTVASVGADDNGPLDVNVTDGSDIVCTITNVRETGMLEVVKQLSPSTDPGRFDLQVDGSTQKSDAGDGDTTGKVTLNTGTHSVGEVAGSTGDLGDYQKSIVCKGDGGDGSTVASVGPDHGGPLDVNVTYGSDIVCTVTNIRETGTIEVVKNLQPSTDNGLFDLQVDASTKKSDAGDGGTTGQVTVDTGSHTVGEVAGSSGDLGDYVKGIVCKDGEGQTVAQTSGNDSGPLNVPVAYQDAIVCTITNTRKATVIVHKVTIPAGSETLFDFSSDLPVGSEDGSFQLADGQTKTVSVDPGSDHFVEETSPVSKGYKLTDLSCTQSVPDEVAVAATPRLVSVDGRYDFHADAGDVIECTYTNTKIDTGIAVKKSGPAFAYSGDTLTFNYDVTNPGNEPLSDVGVIDDKCSSVTLASKNGDGSPGTLDPGDKWTFTCSYVITHNQGDTNPVTNTATASGTTGDTTVTATDTHDTLILHPKVGIAKTGPATALAGSLVGYTLTVTNPGDVAFADPLVVVTDTLCQAPPALSSKNGDSSPLTFDPSDTWTYTCSVQTQVGQTAVDNVADVKGTDQNGRSATAQAKFSTQLTQPEVAVPPQVQVLPETIAKVTPGSAKLRGPTGCPTSAATKATVTGKRITKVTFYVDGKKFKTVTRPDSKGNWSVTLKPKTLPYGSHKVRATIQFAADSGTKAKTLSLTFNRCRPAIVKPKFTG
jgi:uncharacterized repeat protein (TIGR01451 family)